MAENRILFDMEKSFRYNQKEWPDEHKYGKDLIMGGGRANKNKLMEIVARNAFYNFAFDEDMRIDFSGKTIELAFTPQILDDVKEKISNSVKDFKTFVEDTMNRKKKIIEDRGMEYKIENVYIYLAGNTCRCKVVKEAFDEHFKGCEKRIHFISNDEDINFTPKTMVALGQIIAQHEKVGLVDLSEKGLKYSIVSRAGGNVKVIIESNKDYRDWVFYEEFEDSNPTMLYTIYPKPEELKGNDERIKTVRGLKGLLKTEEGALWLKPDGKSKVLLCSTESEENPPKDGDEVIEFDLEKKK